MSSTMDTSCRWRQREKGRSVEDNRPKMVTYKDKNCHDRFLKWKNLEALPAETEPKKNVCQGPIHHLGQLNSLGLRPVILCGISECGLLTLKNPNKGTHKLCR